MRIRRGLLFWGLFLIPLGAIPLLARAGIFPADRFADVWRFWPVLLIGLGLALLLGRGRAGIAATVVLALVLGTLGGAVLATGLPSVGSVTTCVGPGADMTAYDRDGAFTGDATATIELDCGTLAITTPPGSGWRVHGDVQGNDPRFESTGTSLTLRSPDQVGLHRQAWTIDLGAEATRAVDLQVNAGTTTANLAGAQLESLDVQANAGDVLIDATGGQVGTLDAELNAGRLRLTLDGATSGSLQANAGSIELCVPPDAALTFQVQDQLIFSTNLGDRGLQHDGDTWSRPGTGPAISFDIEGNAASFSLDPTGGCQ